MIVQVMLGIEVIGLDRLVQNRKSRERRRRGFIDGAPDSRGASIGIIERRGNVSVELLKLRR
jgi:hypothetical protein